jgi:hypothetical protein
MKMLKLLLPVLALVLGVISIIAYSVIANQAGKSIWYYRYLNMGINEDGTSIELSSNFLTQASEELTNMWNYGSSYRPA